MLRRLILPPGAFRLLLSAAVVVSHSSRLDIGRLAVLLFFFLSGFWVSKIWHGEFEGRRWGAFYVSRWLRIAPLYFIVMLGAAYLRHLPMGPENFLLLGVDTTHRDPIGVAWSLDIELQFYLLLPLLLLAPRALMLPGVMVLAVLGWAFSFLVGVNTAFMYLPVFALGALTAATRWKPSQRTALASLGCFVLVSLAIAVTPYTAPFVDKKLVPPFDEDLFGMLWMAPLVPYIAASLAVKSSPLDRDVGNWSYPLYLVHFPLIALCVSHGMSKWFGVGFAIPITLALFYGPDRFFENYRRKLIGLMTSTGAARSTTASAKSSLGA